MRTVLVQLKCTYTCTTSAAHVPTEFREIDFRDVEKVEEFCRGGCGCSTGRVALNALVLEEVKGIITFVMHYVETNAILLPGRIPGYKRDDIKPLWYISTFRTSLIFVLLFLVFVSLCSFMYPSML